MTNPESTAGREAPKQPSEPSAVELAHGYIDREIERAQAYARQKPYGEIGQSDKNARADNMYGEVGKLDKLRQQIDAGDQELIDKLAKLEGYIRKSEAIANKENTDDAISYLDEQEKELNQRLEDENEEYDRIDPNDDSQEAQRKRDLSTDESDRIETELARLKQMREEVAKGRAETIRHLGELGRARRGLD